MSAADSSPVDGTAAHDVSVAEALASARPGRQAAVEERLRLLVRTLGEQPAPDVPALVGQAEQLLRGAPADRIWLAFSVIAARLPRHDTMAALLRTARLDGPSRVLLIALKRARPGTVRVVLDGVTCDVHHTAATDSVSGIQRVVRSVAARWAADHEIELVRWTDDWKAMCSLTATERHRMLGEEVADAPTEIVVPWRSTHLVPELAADAERATRLLALAKYSGNRVGSIGHDCIPLTSPGSTRPGMVGDFAFYLAACREADRVAVTSEASAAEYSGWQAMLSGVRQDGPTIEIARLPVTAREPSPEALVRARRKLGVLSAPMVLVVGSHEPRKNHLAVLQAAELLWREGVSFTLTLVGSGAWRSEVYDTTVEELRGVGRPIVSIRGVPDEELWAGLRLAHCTLFPSLNEGFGLPVAESLAAGTPVITTGYGSTRDIVAPDGIPLGGLLVDPRDDHDIARAMRTMLTDAATYERLKAETAQHRLGDWDTYAADVWRVLVG